MKLHPVPVYHVVDTSPSKPKHFHACTLKEWINQNAGSSITNEANVDIVWITAGSGMIDFDGNLFEVTAGSVSVITAGQKRHLSFSGDVDGFYLSFSPLFLRIAQTGESDAIWRNQLENGLQAPVSCIHIGAQNEMTEIIQRIFTEYSNYFIMRLEILQGLLNVLMIYLTRRRGAPLASETGKDQLTVTLFLRLVARDFKSKKMVADYAGIMHLSPNYLNKLVKKITGFPASYHIQQQILAEAKKQALNRDHSMKQIAYSLGFENVFHFSRFFKVNTGINFSQFKKEHLLLQ
ncbi:MAG: hypothetical protein DI535_18270 [Citrobacter freundii]|nr:MAG: hypothetical protein DI535_18270 [Citrobacter freundii]